MKYISLTGKVIKINLKTYVTFQEKIFLFSIHGYIFMRPKLNGYILIHNVIRIIYNIKYTKYFFIRYFIESIHLITIGLDPKDWSLLNNPTSLT